MGRSEREPDTRVIARPSRGRRHSPLSALVRAPGLTCRSSPSVFAQNRPGRFRDAEAPGSNPGIPTMFSQFSTYGGDTHSLPQAGSWRGYGARLGGPEEAGAEYIGCASVAFGRRLCVDRQRHPRIRVPEPRLGGPNIHTFREEPSRVRAPEIVECHTRPRLPPHMQASIGDGANVRSAVVRQRRW